MIQFIDALNSNPWSGISTQRHDEESRNFRRCRGIGISSAW